MGRTPLVSHRRLTGPGRRAVLVSSAVALTALLVPLGITTANADNNPDPAPASAAAFAKLNPVTPLTDQTFADPAQGNMPLARWNFPPATATIAGLEADIQDAYDHNIGGLEIGQGGVPTTDQLLAIYKKANALGIKISLKAANGLPGTTYDASNDYARRTLGNYRLAVNAGQNLTATLPGPASGNPGTIVAVLAYRCSATCGTSGTVSLERSSVVDLTSTIAGTNSAGYNGGSTTGSINWTAPASPSGAQWVVLTFRAIPFGAEPETLSSQGTKQVTDAYDTYFSGELGSLVKANNGDFFVDSHASDPWGAPEELWSSNMRTAFQSSEGYDIVPELAALVDPTMAGAGLGGPPPASSLFYSFSDGSATRVRSDFNKVRSDLYTQNRIVQFQDWARAYNMKLRLQQEDGPITSIGDQLQTSAVLDRPEYESLTGSDQTDIYRPMASANHMTGNTWYSTECCAVLNNSYMETYQDAIIRMNKEFAGGVNRIVYHIRPYIDTPTTSWPGLGFSATSKVSFSNAWNRTEPYYVQDAAAMNDYFARNNLVLTQGAAKMDVAVYQRNYSSPSAFSTSDPSNRHWMDLGLQQAGYTWDYLDEALFNLPNAKVTNNRLAQSGPDYKALIFDQFLYPSSNTARGSMTLEAANDILGYAKAGLPVIFVGTPTGTGGLPASDDAALAGIVAQILALPNVHQVASEAAVPAALSNIGVQPAAQPAQPTTLLSVRRRDANVGAEYYYLYNQGVDAAPASTAVFGKNPSNLYEAPTACRVTTANNPCMATGTPVDTTVTLEGSGVPFLLDTFSGKITPIAQYTSTGHSVTVQVKLAADASTVIALLDQPKKIGVANLPTRGVASTTADSAAFVGNSLVVRAAQPGTYTTTLTNGRTVTSTIPGAPAAIDLTNTAWHLDAQDWQPTNPFGTTGEAGTATTKVPVSLDLSALKAWPDIPQLARASGVGTYTTTVALPQDWDSSYGAVLSLGQVTDTFTLKVNGTSIPVDQISGKVDVGSYLRSGDNTLQITVSTTLNNRLFQLDTATANRGVLQNYGLVGPVILSPYRQATVVGGDTSK